ncbi:MAG TPA: hypothetical protein VIZ17_11675 [Acetobacteraceae bacterium]
MADWSRVGIVVGLTAEARLVRVLGGPVAVGGGTADGARQAAERLVASGARALVSIGLAGGLDPSMRPGHVLVPEAVLHREQSFVTDDELRLMLGGATPHRLLGAGRVVAHVAEKRAFWRHTGCAAVDLESGAVAQHAADMGLPFAVLRVICDPGHRELPPASLVALGPDGRISVQAILRSIIRQPSQISALVMLAADAIRARKRLRDHLRRITAGASNSGEPQ